MIGKAEHISSFQPALNSASININPHRSQLLTSPFQSVAGANLNKGLDSGKRSKKYADSILKILRQKDKRKCSSPQIPSLMLKATVLASKDPNNN